MRVFVGRVVGRIPDGRPHSSLLPPYGGAAWALRSFASRHAPLPPKDGVKWSDFGFGLNLKEHSKMVVLETGTSWKIDHPMEVTPYQPLSLEPSATILNYGQGIFEGVKAHRTVKDRIVIFRGDKNGERLSNGASAMSMPPVPHAVFMKAIAKAVRENSQLVPPVGQGSLYLRPILFGSGGILGLGPSSNYHFLTYVSPVGEYFKGTVGGARMKIERAHNRAALNGSGNAKAGGNYAPCFKYQKQAKAEGYTDIIYMDNCTGRSVEEVACANVFFVEPDRISTPSLGTILPGITRATVIQLINELSDSELGGRRLYEGEVTLENMARAEEAFCTGTAAVITPIEHIGDPFGKSGVKGYNYTPMGPITTKLREILTSIQAEKVPDTHGWLRDPFSDEFWK